MNLRFLSAGFVLCLPALLAAAAAVAADITVQEPWARANPPVVSNSAAYMTLMNHGRETDRLMSVAGDIARSIELHTHLNEDGMMKMRPVPAIDVKPGASTALEPGGLHVMLIGLQAPLAEGQRFELILNFEKAGAITVAVPVRGVMTSMEGHGRNKRSEDQPMDH